MARILVLDMLHNHSRSWLKLGFQNSISIAAWIDNFYVAADTPHNATRILTEAEQYLQRTWQLSIKPSSRLFLPVRGNRQEFTAEGWTSVHIFPCLGHKLEHSGSVSACFEYVVGSCWRSFWSNVSRTAAGRLSLSLFMTSFNRSVTPILSFRVARWPFVLAKARHLDTVQRRMIRLSVPVRRFASETDAVYGRRAARAVTDIQHALIPWSLLWAAAVVNWAANLLRNTGRACWGANLLSFRSPHELDELRCSNSSRRPGTRLEPGFTCRRWTDSVRAASAFVESFESSRRRPYANSFRNLSYKRLDKLVQRALESVKIIEENSSHL